LSALYVNDGFVAFPGDGQDTTEFVESLDPAAHAAQLLTAELRFRGVIVGADGRSGASPEGVQPLAGLESPPIRTILAQMLQESDNSTAELLLKELGRTTDRGGTSIGGAAALTAVLSEAGFTVDGTRVLDGSGVANGDLTTCRLMAEVLADDRVDEVIVDGLAVAGETGTLSNRFRDTELAGNVRGKTGSLRIVSALAGQVDTSQGGALQFAYLINVEPGQVVSSDLFVAQEQLARILFEHPDLPDPEALGPR
jgi:D-alanyl-D-alanine carboxypeptidase/D-alanyl-D-alanine-endopeptidase (penicillin-binding protein 4)